MSQAAWLISSQENLHPFGRESSWHQKVKVCVTSSSVCAPWCRGYRRSRQAPSDVSPPRDLKVFLRTKARALVLKSCSSGNMFSTVSKILCSNLLELLGWCF